MIMKRTYPLIKFALVFIAAAFIFLAPANAQTTVLETQAASTLYLPWVAMNFSGDDGFGDVSGTVHDARTGNPLEGIVVCLEDTSTCAPSTQADGNYLIQNIPNGVRNFTAEDPDSAYSQGDEKVFVVTNLTVALNFNLFPVLEENQFRVILTWDENTSWPCAPYICPNDFNLHMWWTLDNITYERYDIDHRGNCQDLEIYPNVCYENDEQYGAGPDAIAFKYRNVSSKGIYYIAVLNYYADWPNVPTFFERSPRARVQVFDSSQELPVFDLTLDPSLTLGDGDLWYILQINFGNPITQNCLLQFDQVGDLPPEECYPDLSKIWQ